MASVPASSIPPNKQIIIDNVLIPPSVYTGWGMSNILFVSVDTGMKRKVIPAPSIIE